MKIGIVRALIFYGIGFGIAGIVYLIIGHPYIHAPGIHHFILLLTVLIGLIWTIISLAIYFFKEKTKTLSGFILTNLIIIIGCALYIEAPLYLDSKKKNNVPTEFIKTEVTGDTTKIYHNENLIFIKVKDSVLLDLR
ncbi:hypothetical protein CW736_11505 [Nonlabens sp. MB-3u-79]|uniref:hypothetical protein n=1 Tax=Nonlabens sp. MB-3u-79 TaxID=2058134 RepID=UPI000C300EED|nr:hypothetical protein [Nonlabens sp. MB-3u-79]AUC79950.1 hypothetical protein CW736_11505 [Nonlabens sp. MB-3u-79]